MTQRNPTKKKKDKRTQKWGKRRCVCFRFCWVELIIITCAIKSNVPEDILELTKHTIKKTKASLTESGACFRPWHWWDNDKTESFVLATANLYVIRLQSRGGGDWGGVGGLRGRGGSCSSDHSIPTDPHPGPSSAAAANAGGGATTGADGVEGILAAL